MKKKVLALLTILFFVILTSAAFAQSSAPSDQETRPGPGYGSSAGPGGGYGYGPGYGMGPGYGYAPGEGQYYPNRHYNMMGGGWGIFMFIFMLIFLGLVIAGIVLLVRYLSPHSISKPSQGALEVLKLRYARGEIQKVEFEEKRKDLES
jgi:putative membrane protein